MTMTLATVSMAIKINYADDDDCIADDDDGGDDDDAFPPEVMMQTRVSP